MRTIYIMSGLPEAGKSTYANNQARPDDIVIHRDDFRADLRRERNTDKYFPVPAKEEYKMWMDHIQRVLTFNPNKNVWIDQTTVTQAALNKVLNGIMPAITPQDEIYVIVLHCSLKICLERNAKRVGPACVPENVIQGMHESMAENPIDTISTFKAFPDLNYTIYHTTETEDI